MLCLKISVFRKAPAWTSTALAPLAQIKYFSNIITSIIINNSAKIGGKKNLDSSKRAEWRLTNLYIGS